MDKYKKLIEKLFTTNPKVKGKDKKSVLSFVLNKITVTNEKINNFIAPFKTFY